MDLLFEILILKIVRKCNFFSHLLGVRMFGNLLKKYSEMLKAYFLHVAFPDFSNWN